MPWRPPPLLQPLELRRRRPRLAAASPTWSSCSRTIGDLGHYDVAFNGNAAAAVITANITKLATEGIILRSHYVHWHCSPTRRSFLSGRLPVHHHEQLSGTTTDDLDLRYTWISAKLN